MTDPTPEPEIIPQNDVDTGQVTEDRKMQSVPPNMISRATFNYVVIAVAFFLLGLVIGAVAARNLNTAISDNVEHVVRGLLEEAAILRPLQNMAQLVDDDPYIGDVDAPIVIVEFSAYACPYCGRFHNETLPPLLENYGQYIRYVYRDFPSVNPEVSYAAALAAACALDQDQYWEYQKLLFENQDKLGSTYLMEVADELGLDMEAFRECYQSQEHLVEIEADFQDGVAVGINGTPSFYINGRFHSGARPYNYFESVILEELERLGIGAESG